MDEESDTRIERLEKAHQDQQGQIAKMMEMLRTLVNDKRQAVGPQGFTPPYVQTQPMPQMKRFP